ncbi:hypothetical protein [Pseudodesulfovibrio sediminis]|uniref:Uncharacterized protein n=1 Tax=Pseudodesulfovibrio sediminis TaxID=2810563 RepID=A0ABM7P3C1_9BACT|nr:hypothetical protein [Pseudodesulfovibrio sediminis]BCS87335.1 hypothetical protein PSDVSF_05770 [Pseudodesulfovibrio sediminis]
MADEPIETPTEAPVQDTPPADDGGGDNWIASVPEEFREASFVAKYKTPEDFFKGVDNLSKLAGQKQKGLVAPGEGASEEEVAAFNTSLRELSGVPGSLEEYQGALQLPELGEGAMMPKFIEMGFTNGVPPQAMQSIISGLSEELANEEQAVMQAYSAELQKNMDAVKRDWGDEFDYKLNVGERFLSKFSDETRQMLTDADWKNKAPLVRDLYELGNRYLGEGDLADVNSGGTGGSDVPTMAGLVAMKEDLRYKDQDQRDPNYVNEVHEYAKRLTEFQQANKN